MSFRGLFVLLVLGSVSSADAAATSISCALTESPDFISAKAALDAGHLNLAYLTLDRVVRASAKNKDPAKFLAALSCLDQVQDANALVDLPNYDDELGMASPRVKSPEGNAVLAHFAYRSALQRVATGAHSSKSISPLLPYLKSNPTFESAIVGLSAAARADYGVAKPALEKAIRLSAEAKPAFQAELRLAYGRALYAGGDDAGAIAQYEALYKIGAPMQDALIESGWAHLRSKNYMKAIGLSFELATGKLSQFFAPEASSIRSIGFLENCRYSEARNTIARFTAEYGRLGEWLNRAKKSGASLYELAIARAEGAVGAEAVPEKIWSMWSSSDSFLALQSGIRGGFAEERDAKEFATAQKLEADYKKLSVLRERAAMRIEELLERLNKGMGSRISREAERMRFVRVEANQGAGRDLVYRNANPGLADVEKKVAKADRKAKSYKGKLDWGKVDAEDPNVEMWIDEIGNYEAATLDRCKAKTEYKKQKTGN